MIISGRQNDGWHTVCDICCLWCGECSKNLCPHRCGCFWLSLNDYSQRSFGSSMFFSICQSTNTSLMTSVDSYLWIYSLKVRRKFICIYDWFDHCQCWSEEWCFCHFWVKSSLLLSRRWWSFIILFLENDLVYCWGYIIVWICCFFRKSLNLWKTIGIFWLDYWRDGRFFFRFQGGYCYFFS